MKNAIETYGAARFGGKLHAARVENDGTRTVVTGLMTSDDGLTGDPTDGAQLFFGVDNSLAMLKKIQVKKNPSADPADMARFEIVQSLLDPPDSFYIDMVPLNGTGGYQRFLSIAYHKKEIDRLAESYERQLRKPSGFKLYAAALVDGYHAFCRREPGDLQVLVDIETDVVTMAVLYKDTLQAARSLETRPGETITSAVARRLAAECKLMVNFDLSELFQEGITVPLSRVLVSGAHARDDQVLAAFRESFGAEIGRPHFEEGYFQSVAETITRYHPERFLIPLGLAVT